MTPSERARLMDDLLENQISEADLIRLEAELSVDAEVRQEYYNRLALSILLESEARQASGTLIIEPMGSAIDVSVRRWRKLTIASLAIVAATLVFFGAWRFGLRPAQQLVNGGDDRHRGAETKDVELLNSGFAVVSGQDNAVWSDGRYLTNGSLVPTGNLKLLSGLAQFELFSGVVLVVEGEAHFRILSPMHVSVTKGKIRATVPEPAHGFQILTGNGKVVDLGTEFAVNVAEGRSEVHVLDGQIEWHPDNAPVQRMARGQATRLTNDSKPEQFAADSGRFVGPAELRERLRIRQESRLDRWQTTIEQLRNDPRLVALYHVMPDELDARRLSNRGRTENAIASEGAIVAASATANRWSQPNRAVDFSPSGSRVRLTVPGEHRSLTMLCWVKINSLDRWYNSLFLTDGHEKGEPHWQIMDDGRLFFSVKKRDQFDRSRGEKDKHIFFSPSFWNNSLSGRWLMIATVYDVDAKLVTHYLNGEVLSMEPIPEEYLVESVHIGSGSIGNWGLPERDEPRFAVRNLNGSIDEFALFSAALSSDEIRMHYHDGKP